MSENQPEPMKCYLCDGVCDYPWHMAYQGLIETVDEEAESLRALVRDPDSSCPARQSRQDRLAALEWVLGVADTLKRWDW